MTASMGEDGACSSAFTSQGLDEPTKEFKLFQFIHMLVASCPRTSFGDADKYKDRVEKIANDDFDFLNGVGDCLDADGKMVQQGVVWLTNLAQDTDLIKCPGQGAVETVGRSSGCTISFYGFEHGDMDRVTAFFPETSN